jgi:hypothetical protein
MKKHSTDRNSPIGKKVFTSFFLRRKKNSNSNSNDSHATAHASSENELTIVPKNDSLSDDIEKYRAYFCNKILTNEKPTVPSSIHIHFRTNAKSFFWENHRIQKF